MKKENKFRGIREDGGGFVYGDLTCGNVIHVGDTTEYQWNGVDVIPETVGQYINRLDRKGVEVYEGDIYQEYWGDLEGDKLKVVFDEADACFCGCDSKGHLHFLLDPSNMVIIGNVHENPDLL